VAGDRPVPTELSGFGSSGSIAATADLDGDGWIDLLFSDGGGAVLWGNAGPADTWRLAPLDTPASSLDFEALRAADLDGDGRVEVFGTHDADIWAFAPPAPEGWWLLWEGDPFALADLTGDGLPDVIRSGHWTPGTHLGMSRPLGCRGGYPAPADLDGDGDLDVIATFTRPDDGAPSVVWCENALY
jgi:hypothetical protein